MPGETTTLTLEINGEDCTVVFPTHHTLLEVLRESCGFTGTKHGCELGECGACAVLIDGRAVMSCLVLAAQLEGRSIETVEGLQQGNDLHPLQTTFADLGAAQCGYCTPGMLMVGKALLEDCPEPTVDQIEESLSGNLCRCTGYHKIVQAVQGASDILRGRDWSPATEHVFGAEAPEAPATIAGSSNEVKGKGDV